MNIDLLSRGMLTLYLITIGPIVLGYLYWREMKKKEVPN